MLAVSGQEGNCKELRASILEAPNKGRTPSADDVEETYPTGILVQENAHSGDR